MRSQVLKSSHIKAYSTTCSLSGDDTGTFRILGLPKALSRYLPEEWGVCAETPVTSCAYFQLVVKPAIVPLAFKWW